MGREIFFARVVYVDFGPMNEDSGMIFPVLADRKKGNERE
jgi:hypothetical protein